MRTEARRRLRLLGMGALPNFVSSFPSAWRGSSASLRRAVIALGTGGGARAGARRLRCLLAIGVTGVGAGLGIQPMRRGGGAAADLASLVRCRLVARQPGDPLRHDPQLTASAPRRGPRSRAAAPGPWPPVRRARAAGAGWTLLRLPSNLEEPTGDVIYSWRRARRRLRCARWRRGLGFVAVPGWESTAGPDPRALRQRLGPLAWLLRSRRGLVPFTPLWHLSRAPPLRSSVADSGARDPLPADGDAFWLLLLHCLLDKGGAVAPHHRTRLQPPARLRHPVAASGRLVSAAGDRGSLDGGGLRPTRRRPGTGRSSSKVGGRLADAAEAASAGLGAVAGAGEERSPPWLRKPLLLPRRQGSQPGVAGSQRRRKVHGRGGAAAYLPFGPANRLPGVVEGLGRAPGAGARCARGR